MVLWRTGKCQRHIGGLSMVWRVVFDYAGVLVLPLLGIGCLMAGFARDDVSLLVVGGVIAIIAVIWAVVGRARGGSLIP